MTNTNKHGLSRDIPEAVARQVRQECGFGCVICGTAIYHYEHVLPEFKDAHSHEVASIALLCASHHDRVTRGHLSKDAVAAARQKPKARELGVASSGIEAGANGFQVLVGGAVFESGVCLGALGELPLLLLLPPEEAGAPARLTAFFPSEHGWSLAIVRNEWRVLVDTVWDVTVEGPVVTIRKKLGKTILQFRMQPPHQFEIVNLEVTANKYSAKLETDGLHLRDATGQRRILFGKMSRAAGVLAFVEPNFACLTAPFPGQSPPPEPSWQDFLLHRHWEIGQRSHGSLIIRPDGGPPKVMPDADHGTVEFPSLKLCDQATGDPVQFVSLEAEVLTLFSFGSDHLAYVPMRAQASGSI